MSAKDSFKLTFAINNELRGKLLPEAAQSQLQGDRVDADEEQGPVMMPVAASAPAAARIASVDAARLMEGLREIELQNVTPRRLNFEP